MKKYLLFILSMISVAFLFAGCAEKKSEYFRKAYLDGKSAIVGYAPVFPVDSSKVNCYHFIYDKNGRLSSVEYLMAGKPAPDNYFKVYKTVISYSPNFEKRTFINISGDPMPCWSKVYSIGIKYDPKNHPTALFNYDNDGRIAADENLTAQYLFTTDWLGRIISEKYFDISGNRTVNKYFTDETRFKYDNKGNEIERVNYGRDGQIKSGFSHAPIVKYKYDADGNLIEERYLGADGQFQVDMGAGSAIVRFKYDKNYNAIKEYFLGADELPVKSTKLGVAAIEWQYFESGAKSEERYLGLDGDLAVRKDWGAAVIRWKYDENGKMLEERYFGVDGKPKNAKDIGIATSIFKYDNMGRLIEKAYLDAIGKPKARIGERAATYKYVYDEVGNFKTKKYGPNGKEIKK